MDARVHVSQRHRGRRDTVSHRFTWQLYHSLNTTNYDLEHSYNIRSHIFTLPRLLRTALCAKPRAVSFQTEFSTRSTVAFINSDTHPPRRSLSRSHPTFGKCVKSDSVCLTHIHYITISIVNVYGQHVWQT